jgi:hypothetical protein
MSSRDNSNIGSECFLRFLASESLSESSWRNNCMRLCSCRRCSSRQPSISNRRGSSSSSSSESYSQASSSSSGSRESIR